MPRFQHYKRMTDRSASIMSIMRAVTQREEGSRTVVASGAVKALTYFLDPDLRR